MRESSSASLFYRHFGGVIVNNTSVYCQKKVEVGRSHQGRGLWTASWDVLGEGTSLISGTEGEQCRCWVGYTALAKM